MNNHCLMHFRHLTAPHIWLKFASFSRWFKSNLYDLFSPNHANELLSSYNVLLYVTM